MEESEHRRRIRTVEPLAVVRRTVQSASRVEAGALIAGAVAAALGFLGGLAVAWGRRLPLSGIDSLGEYVAIGGALLSAAGFVAGYLVQGRSGGSRYAQRTGRPARILDVTALTLTHAALVVMLATGVFFVLQEAFIGATLYTLPSALIAGGVGAVTAYYGYLSASAIDAASVANLLAVFLVGGVLTSMLNADDPHWWEANISALGIARGFSGYSFTVTVVLGGIILTTLARFIGGELDEWGRGRGPATARGIRLTTWALIAIGVCLIGVGLVPVDLSEPVHNTFATGMVLVYVALVVGLRWLLPGFPNAFLIAGYGFLVIIAVSALLFIPFGYYNLTAVELIASALIFTWLIVFIRNITASAKDREHAGP
ncbi:DUF998 domain-containing protein [Agromyces archimandritae]|uniref:DUF998 domain-containing protein n=1 Tax=Agromyces archimandritae TaxID=2781962 RepID=A0A975FKJ7_9MICO|nr:DUF998 domain-containing protein [Agromyces archimandritae]QTX03674.1 hypothetical protein G127AT_10030 [Agromyces archimandritae]